MRRMKVCVPVLVCLCLLCIFVHSPAISHPVTYQSSPLCSSVCIDLLPLSLSLGWSMPQLLPFWSKCHCCHKWYRYFASSIRGKQLERAGKHTVIRLYWKYAELQDLLIAVACFIARKRKLTVYTNQYKIGTNTQKINKLLFTKLYL